MAAASPSVFSIPPGESFVDALARGLLEETAGDPLTLSSRLILLPTRRACRSLREAFLRRSGGRPLLLPRLRPIGDGDEEDLAFSSSDDNDGAAALDLPPAVPPLRRQLLLARLILKLGPGRGGRTPSFEQAARLAGELGRLLDQVQTEGLSFERLESLVSGDFARHWQITLDFLKIVTRHWPEIVESQGWMDRVLRRDRLIEAQADAWEADPPAFPVIAAGSTGSIPATARLLSVVARLPEGRLVLPGLDISLDGGPLEQSHPQYGLQRLLAGLGLRPAEVPQWPGCEGSPRAWLVSEAMRPADSSEQWRRLSPTQAEIARALAGVSRIDCPGPREEAGAIALMMREVLEHDGQTAALVSPDRNLARRVAAELRRFDIEIDDSAGRPLDITAVGAFLLLTAGMAAENFAPHATLAALKHPLALGAQPPGRFRALVRRLEREALRGPRPGPGIAGLKAAAPADLHGWLEGIAHAAKPLSALMEADETSLAALVRAHVALAEALAADESGDGAARLWRGEAGEAASLFLRDLADAADALPGLPARSYPGLLRGLMAEVTVRPRWGGHPRLSVWGPLEARMQHADLLILGGLNEGVWPAAAAADPWMSRPMRQDFGLPLPERRIGLSAHDFVQGFCAPRVVMTRSTRVDGTPTVPSRWLLRLDAVLQACGQERPWEGSPWMEWHSRLDRPRTVAAHPPPAPRPPPEARPRSLSATAIESWMRDPYSIYAKYILKLKALDPIDADPSAADYGDVVHRVLDAFLKRHPRGPLPAAALEELTELGRVRFAPLLDSRPGLAAFWWPRFESVARWFVGHEAARRPRLAEVSSEVKGALSIAAPAGPFTVTARADRIDLMKDGSLVLIDYKTGSPPSAREVAAGYAPQLPVEAAIACRGGFEGVPAKPVGGLSYWRLRGGAQGGEERSAGDDAARLAEQALAGLTGLIAAFDDPKTPYEARPHPEMAPRYSDYLHLARVKEWASAVGEEGEE